MENQPRLPERGAIVTASDGHLGTVQEVVVRPETGQLAGIVVNRGFLDPPLDIPADLIEALTSPHEVRLRVTRDQAAAGGAAALTGPGLARAEGHELRIPILEERLVPGKRVVDLGEVRIHTRVEEDEQVVRQLVDRDDLEIERVRFDRPLTEPATRRYEGDWLVIPVMREVLVTEKRLMLVEEVRIRTRVVTEEQEVRETVRRTVVEVEDATVDGLDGVRTAREAARDRAHG
jgi:stress response protein YsnF